MNLRSIFDSPGQSLLRFPIDRARLICVRGAWPSIFCLLVARFLLVAVLLSTTEISNPSGLPSLEIKDFIERERAFDSREKLPELFELKSLPDLLNSRFQTRKKPFTKTQAFKFNP